jgi:hypothetical protein
MSGTWSTLQNSWPFNGTEAHDPDAMILLSDGSVLVHDVGSSLAGTSSWWRLTPSELGDYSNGTWSGAFNMQYQRQFFASGLMTDGRVFVVGGEYTNDPNMEVPPDRYSPTGEIFDPGSNTWSPLPKPPAFNYIAGDAPCCVLADGRIIFGAYATSQTAIYDPTTTSWTEAGTEFGTKLSTRTQICDEETWTLLPDGSVLTVCTHDAADKRAALRYLPSLDAWISAGNTPSEMQMGYEIGPAILLPNGSVFAIGATGSTALYSLPANPSDPTQTGTWVAGPPFLDPNGNQLTCIDGPAALLPSGNVLCTAGPTIASSTPPASGPATIFEFDYITGQILSTSPPPDTTNIGWSDTNGLVMLLLPTGQVLVTTGLYLGMYTPQGAPSPAWAPIITSCPSLIHPGDQFTLSGQQLNGLSQAVSYGDDYTAATNYPIVQIQQGNNVMYCMTSTFSTLGVATGQQGVTAQVNVPLKKALTILRPGPAELVVIANGIASDPIQVEISGTPNCAALVQSVKELIDKDVRSTAVAWSQTKRWLLACKVQGQITEAEYNTLIREIASHTRQTP